jgi:hypothetical protein
MEDSRVGTRGLYAAPQVKLEHSPALDHTMLTHLLMEEQVVPGRMQTTDIVYH